MSGHRRKSVVLKAGWIAESVVCARQTGYTRFCWPAYQYRSRQRANRAMSRLRQHRTSKFERKLWQLLSLGVFEKMTND